MSDMISGPAGGVAPQSHSFERHPYDYMMRGKGHNAFRLADPRHQGVNVGDIVHMHDRPDAVQRQKFLVVTKTEHPTIEQAVNNIQHSTLSARDKIQMTHDFRSFHGMSPSQHSGSVVHFEFHPVAGGPGHL